MSITKPDVPAKNVTDDWDREHAFQLGDGPRLPAGKREDTAVARWIEIDARRRDARIAGNPFAYTAAERQLKRRLLKAGLIILKPQPRPARRADAELEIATLMAKVCAAAGDADALRWLQYQEEERKRAAWVKRERALRKLPPQTLLAAVKDVVSPRDLFVAAQEVMAAKGIRRSLAPAWGDFADVWENSSDERRAAFLAEHGSAVQSITKPDVLAENVTAAVMQDRP
jgi:hypothetical protein